MKLSIALFTALITASHHHLLVSAADASVDGGATSRPHLRALADVAVDDCDCNINSNNCDAGYFCQSVRTVGSGNNNCGTCQPIPCNTLNHCDITGYGCPSGTTCENGPNGLSDGNGCYGCRSDDSGFGPPPLLQNDEDGSEATSLRASILEEE